MLVYILAAMAAIIAALFYIYAIKPMSYWKNRGVDQGKPVWLAGDSWTHLLRRESFFDMMLRHYKELPGIRYSGFYQFTVPTLLIKDPELIKQISIKDFEHFVDRRRFITEKADPLMGNNLFTLTGQKWRDMRIILSPTFTSSKIKGMFLLMSECAQSFNQYYLDKNEDLIEVEFKDTFTRFTNDVIGTTAFGIKTDSLRDRTNEFYMNGREATDFSGLLKNLKFFGLFLCPRLYEIFKISLFGPKVSNFFIELIANNIQTRKNKGIVRQDLIQLLMEAEKLEHQIENNDKDGGFEENNLGIGKAVRRELTTLEMTAQAVLFFFAGFDGVASAMCCVAYELATNPDCQDKLRTEILKTLEECKGNITYDALNRMKYMDMVISETLRKWPIALVTDRVCTKPYTIEAVNPNEKSLHLETGTVVMFPIIGIHRNPDYYPDPDRFDPERFNDNNKENILPYTYLPFGVGPRNCIGNRFALIEIKVIIFYILSKFELVPTARSQIPIKLCRKQLNISAEDGFWFGLKRIKN